MAGVNKVILVGRLGKDPEIRSTSNGTPVASLTLATSESWTKNGQKEEKTEWHNIVLWSHLAELAGKYLAKGRQVYIEGRLQTRSWDDKNGVKRYRTEIVGNMMQFLDGGSQNANAPTQNDYASQAPNPYQQSQGNAAGNIPSFDMDNISKGSEFPTDDDIPF